MGKIQKLIVYIYVNHYITVSETNNNSSRNTIKSSIIMEEQE